jgi:hypothetical protein
MTQFRECVILVFERLGLEAPAAGYLDDIERLNNAAAEWHSRGGGVLHFELPDLLSGAIVTGNLSDAAKNGFAVNDAAKAFVRDIDECTGRRGTLLMLQIILLIQQAVQTNKVNAMGGVG